MKNSEYVGKTIMIHWLQDDPEADKYAGRVGVVKEVDDLGQLHGTWGGLAVIPEVDDFEVVKYEDPDDAREEAMLEEYNGKTVAEVLAEFEADDDLSGAVDFLEDYLGYDIRDAEALERDRSGFSKDYDFDYVYVDDMGMEWPISDFSDIYFIVEENGTDLDPVEGLEEELKVRDNAFVMDHKEEESENQALKSAKPISSQAAVKAAIKDRVDLHADKIKDAIKDANPGKEVDHVCKKEPVVLHSEDDLKDLKEEHVFGYRTIEDEVEDGLDNCDTLEDVAQFLEYLGCELDIATPEDKVMWEAEFDYIYRSEDERDGDIPLINKEDAWDIIEAVGISLDEIIEESLVENINSGESTRQSIEDFKKKTLSRGVAELLKTKPEAKQVINQIIQRFLDGDFGDVPETIANINRSKIRLPIDLRNIAGFYNCTVGADNELIKLVISQTGDLLQLLLYDEVPSRRLR